MFKMYSKRLMLACLLLSPNFSSAGWKDKALSYAPMVGKYLFGGVVVSFMGWQWFHNKKQTELFNNRLNYITRAQMDKDEYENLCLNVLQRSLSNIIDEKLKQSPDQVNEHPGDLITDLSILLRKEEEYRRLDNDLTYLWEFVFGKRALADAAESQAEPTKRPHIFPNTNLFFIIKNMIFKRIKAETDDIDDEVIIRKKVTSKGD